VTAWIQVFQPRGLKIEKNGKYFCVTTPKARLDIPGETALIEAPPLFLSFTMTSSVISLNEVEFI